MAIGDRLLDWAKAVGGQNPHLAYPPSAVDVDGRQEAKDKDFPIAFVFIFI